MRPCPRAERGRRLGVLCGVLSLLVAVSSSADELILKNGTILQGIVVQVPGLNIATAHQNIQGPVPSSPYWMVDDSVRRYFVFRRQVAEHIDHDDLARLVTFELKRDPNSRTVGPVTVGAFGSVGPWDEYGRRTVTLATRRGLEPIIQEITELKPTTTAVSGLKHAWDYYIDTRTLPPHVIQALIEQASDRGNPAERKAAVQFYLQAEMFPQAKAELDRLAEEFPDYSDWCHEFQLQITEVNARRGLHELERRRDAGQHMLAYHIAKTFPPDRVSADVLRGARDIAEDYEQAHRDGERAAVMLDMLQAELPEEQARPLRSLRAILLEELHYETLDRLRPFLRSEEDDSLKPDQKLALAYSGWVLGGTHAILDLNEALRLWKARFLVLEYLRTDRDPRREMDILTELAESEGVNVNRLTQMIPLLPLPFEPPVVTPSVAFDVDVPVEPDEAPVKYTLMLPPEYSPHHRYPLLVVLRGEGRTFQETLHWWAGDATRPGWGQRRGYLVVAPHYCEETATNYAGGTRAHEVVQRTIGHLRKRYRVDSDRIFLAGHGMGADACYDVGMSLPGLFAGAVPIAGICERVCTFYWKNAPHLSWYIVGGEKDRNSLDQNAPIINNMMKQAYDVLYCDYKNRGFESYHEEQERIFAWMQPLRRVPLKDVAKFEAGTLRRTDNAFYWMEGQSLPDRLFPPLSWDQPQRKVPRTFKGNFAHRMSNEDWGTISVDHPGQRTRIWFSPELFDFDKRCRIRVNLKWVYNDFVAPSIESLLEDLRERGDRERLFWARLDL